MLGAYKEIYFALFVTKERSFLARVEICIPPEDLQESDSCFRVISSAINRQLVTPFISPVEKRANETCLGEAIIAGQPGLLSRGKYEWPKRVRSRDCDRRRTLVVLLSHMIYDGRPRKGTSLNPALPRPYICVTCKIAHFTALCELLAP